MVRKILKGIALFLVLDIVIILIYGFVQYPKAKGEQHFIAERIVNAPKDKVWKTISDVGNYHKVTAPNIDHVEIVEGEGLGMKRVCSAPDGSSWEETCTFWKPGEAYKFEVNTQREDYPFPLKSLSGIWKVDSIAPNKTKLSMDFAYEFNNPFLSGYFLSMGSKQAEEDTEFLLDNWQRLAENNNN
ncbi:SRPBCC family protein [Aquimarina sp. MMG016]|uniref:SRPBCC family protein n=1 Tax=Aquimarina sp. MMG016 TaxID=2822690 RepID=UPI001B3A686B|nr:SRPBCC family protein [Aquimarina sp. MMG016]MBQ4820398.1 SRPBCC family protein [Aquimarina sp. MMG016]